MPSDTTANAPMSPSMRRVIDAAAFLFDRDGYDGTSIRDIAHHVGLAKSSIYSHIASKEDLLYLLSMSEHQRFHEAILDRDDPTLAPAERLHLLIERHLRTMMADSVRTRVAHWAQTSKRVRGRMSAERIRDIARLRDLYRDHVVELLRLGQADGSIVDNLDAELLAVGFLASLNGATQWYRPKAFTPDLVVAAYAQMLMGGLLTDTTSARAAPRTPRSRSARGARS
jgi:AcrR family transcriptional regulator